MTRFYHQIRFALEALLTYVYSASQNRGVTKQFAKRLSEKGVNLLEKLEKNKVDLSAAEEELNQLIQELNTHLPPFPEYTLYPQFDLGNESLQVTLQVIAFQQFLNQGLRAGQMDLDVEGPIFDEAMHLWRRIATPRIAPHDAMQELSYLIKRGNECLKGEEEFYPLPEPNFYSTKL